MKKRLTILFLFLAFISQAQRSMFVGNNNYVAPVAPAFISTTGLLLYLDAGNTSSYPGTGTTWYDLSTNVNNGTLATSSMANTASTPKNITFNGTSNYVSLASSKFNVPYTGKTVIAAAKMSSNFGTNQYRALSGNTGSRNFNFYIYQNGSGFQVHFSAAGAGWLSDVLQLVTGQWYVFAVTQDDTTVKFFVNGALVGTNTGAPFQQYQSSTDEFVGRADNYWNGDIGSIFIYKRGLSDVEILQNFNAIKSVYGL